MQMTTMILSASLIPNCHEAQTVTQDQVVTPATSKECLIQTPTIKIRLILLQFYIIFVFRQKFPT